MGVLLERARRVFRAESRTLPPAEAFEIVCVCGERLRGFRQDQAQFPRCSQCGHTAFVLPLSPYPLPAPVEKPAKPRGGTVSELRPKRPLGIRLRIRGRRAKRRVAAGLRRLRPPPRWFSRGRLLTVALIAVVSATTALTIHLTRRSSLTGTILESRAVWTAALEKGDFATASNELNRAALSLKRYGSRGREQREIEQLAREVALFTDLLNPTLEELTDQARSLSSDEWLDYFRTLKNPALLWDAHVIPAIAGEENEYRLHSTLFAGPEPIQLDTSGLRLFQSLKPQEPKRVLFGARILSIERRTSDHEWLIRLVPDSGVLLTSSPCLEKIGWPLDEATRSILNAQKEWVLEQP